MSSSYAELSLVPNRRIDLETGEATPVKKHTKTTNNKARGVLDIPNQGNNYLARQVCGKVGETLIKVLLKNHLSKKRVPNYNLFDLVFVDGSFGEVKTGRYGNRAVIIESQLQKMPQNGFYCLVYYKIEGFKTATEALVYAKDKGLKSGESFLKKRVKVKSVFVFPRSDIVYFYNLPTTTKNKIRDNKKGQPTEYFVGLGVTGAKKLFLENPGDFEQTHFSLSEGKIPVYMTGFPDIQL
nr:hypothetical protein [Candidatus Gracilibacteria bacterium]